MLTFLTVFCKLEIIDFEKFLIKYKHEVFIMNEMLMQCEYEHNDKLYEFLATNYDISDLARKIVAAKSANVSLTNLKKIVNGLI